MKYQPNPFPQVATAQAATFNGQGDVSSDFVTSENWIVNAWDQSGDYHFASSVTNGADNTNNGSKHNTPHFISAVHSGYLNECKNE